MSKDLVDDYEEIIKSITEKVIDLGIEPQVGFLEILYSTKGEIPHLIDKAIKFRRDIGICKQDIGYGNILLNMSPIYSEFQDREAAFVVCVEITRKFRIRNLELECESYNKTQPIFQQLPQLWEDVIDNNSRDLIKINSLSNFGNSRLYSINKTKIKLSNHLSPNLISFLMKEFPNHDIYARFDPYRVSTDLLEPVNEEVMRSDKSNWWKNLEIYPNQKCIRIYELQQINEKDLSEKNIKKSYEYTQGFGKLETHFKRNSKGLLSGSIEELKRPENKDYSIAFYLHITSESSIGTEWDVGVASHIDGAINVYTGKSIKDRWEKSIANGKTVDACFRTHLFRVNNIPFKYIIPLSEMFFRSSALMKDWFNDSFADYIKS